MSPRGALKDTAEYRQSLYDQTLALMNSGAPLDEVIHSVKPPANLIEKPSEMAKSQAWSEFH